MLFSLLITYCAHWAHFINSIIFIELVFKALVFGGKSKKWRIDLSKKWGNYRGREKKEREKERESCLKRYIPFTTIQKDLSNQTDLWADSVLLNQTLCY